MVGSEKMKIIYHGSYEIVQYPNIIVGKNTKDFSYGFYCTRIKEEAEWSYVNILDTKSQTFLCCTSS